MARGWVLVLELDGASARPAVVLDLVPAVHIVSDLGCFVVAKRLRLCVVMPDQLLDSDQLNNMGVLPFVTRLKDARAKTLISTFPMYDAGILEAYSRTAPLTN